MKQNDWVNQICGYPTRGESEVWTVCDRLGGNRVRYGVCKKMSQLGGVQSNWGLGEVKEVGRME